MSAANGASQMPPKHVTKADSRHGRRLAQETEELPSRSGSAMATNRSRTVLVRLQERLGFAKISVDFVAKT